MLLQLAASVYIWTSESRVSLSTRIVKGPVEPKNFYKLYGYYPRDAAEMNYHNTSEMYGTDRPRRPPGKFFPLSPKTHCFSGPVIKARTMGNGYGN